MIFVNDGTLIKATQANCSHSKIMDALYFAQIKSEGSVVRASCFLKFIVQVNLRNVVHFV